MFKSPGHIAFSFSSIDIYWYGIIMSLSILAGLFVILYYRKKYFKDISADTICDITFLLIIFGIIFARLYYVILDYKYFLKNIWEIFAVWNGGISIHGAIFGGVLIGYLYAKDNKLNFLRYADLFSIGLTAGQVIGRWGNFFNSEAFGLPCNLPWKLYIPYSLRPLEYKNIEFFHPAFLYESILNFIVLIILIYILKKGGENRKNGVIFFSYIILYSIVRIAIESIRVDSVLNIYGFHIAHIVSIILIIIGVCGLFKILNQKTS